MQLDGHVEEGVNLFFISRTKKVTVRKTFRVISQKLLEH